MKSNIYTHRTIQDNNSTHGRERYTQGEVIGVRVRMRSEGKLHTHTQKRHSVTKVTAVRRSVTTNKIHIIKHTD